MAKELIIDKFKLITDKIVINNQGKKILIMSDLHIWKYAFNKYGKEMFRLIEKYL